MATIESKSERDNLKNIVAAHPKLFLEEFYIDGHNLTANQKPSFCISMERVMRGQLKANEIGCDHSDKKFMCEDVDVVDVYVETAEVPTKLNLDIRNTFFSYLGSHGKCRCLCLNERLLNKCSNCLCRRRHREEKLLLREHTLCQSRAR